MALSQSALLDLVEELKTTDASELMRRMLATMLQDLIDVEASAVIGALPHERTEARTTQRGPLRFGALREAVDGISGKVLTETLRDLERDGIASRTVYNEMPPRVECELTPLGQTLRQPLTALGRWAEKHIEDVLRAREDYDQRSGSPNALP